MFITNFPKYLGVSTLSRRQTIEGNKKIREAQENDQTTDTRRFLRQFSLRFRFAANLRSSLGTLSCRVHDRFHWLSTPRLRLPCRFQRGGTRWRGGGKKRRLSSSIFPFFFSKLIINFIIHWKKWKIWQVRGASNIFSFDKILIIPSNENCGRFMLRKRVKNYLFYKFEWIYLIFSFCRKNCRFMLWKLIARFGKFEESCGMNENNKFKLDTWRIICFI